MTHSEVTVRPKHFLTYSTSFTHNSVLSNFSSIKAFATITTMVVSSLMLRRGLLVLVFNYLQVILKLTLFSLYNVTLHTVCVRLESVFI